ncbi:MAG: putative RsbT co-antagonist protein rsbRA [Burkholderiales bacterium]|nr:putative RsbT co-antagonist protein rsbRA [Burkholderiales bacterium]
MNKQRASSKIPTILKQGEKELLEDWIRRQLESTTLRSDLLKAADLRNESAQFLSELKVATQNGALEDLNATAWLEVKSGLAELSRSRAQAGFSATETATFLLSLKQPLFARLRQEFASDAEGLAEDIWRATQLIDHFGLYATEVFQQAREDIIARQQRELLELSTPVVQLWDDILALPLVGTLDSERTQVVMETLLQKIVDTGAAIAIIDITGVPTVDTLVAQHLIKTVSATRLMGADCIISGIRPQIAQTIVHLGVNLGEIPTKATLADAFAVALKRTGASVRPNGEAQR